MLQSCEFNYIVYNMAKFNLSNLFFFNLCHHSEIKTQILFHYKTSLSSLHKLFVIISCIMYYSYIYKYYKKYFENVFMIYGSELFPLPISYKTTTTIVNLSPSFKFFKPPPFHKKISLT